jgi:hypothetical protein
MNKQRNASVATLIKEAELLSAPLEFVHNFYFEQSKLEENKQSEDVDDYTEQRLLEKNNPFVDLTLAQYCFYPETLATLFAQATASGNIPLSLACISNTSVARRRFSIHWPPTALFLRDNSASERVEAWFLKISEQEIEALFKNPTIGDTFLTNFLEGKACWQNLSEQQQMKALESLYYNPRVSTVYDKRVMDGWAEYKHQSVANAIWNLTKSLPVEKEWAALICGLLERVRGGGPDGEVSELVRRWKVVEEDAEPNEKKEMLSDFERIRFSLYLKTEEIRECYIRKDRQDRMTQYLDNDDIAFRAAVYAKLSLGAHDIKYAYEKDALVAIHYLLDNRSVWRNESSREALHDICWDADGRYNNNYLHCANNFNWKKEQLETEHPDWFAEEVDSEDSEIDETKQMVSVSMAKELLSDWTANPALQYLAAIHGLVSSSTKEISKLKWIYGVLIGLIVLEFCRR